jgi:hypothetical protein
MCRTPSGEKLIATSSEKETIMKKLLLAFTLLTSPAYADSVVWDFTSPVGIYGQSASFVGSEALYSRPGNDMTRRFPLIAEALTGLRSRSRIVRAYPLPPA